jgi:hypothetical protein
MPTEVSARDEPFGNFGNAENSRAETRGGSAISAMPIEVGSRHAAGAAGCSGAVARPGGFRQFGNFGYAEKVRRPTHL